MQQCISLNLQDALSDWIPGGGVNQHGGGCQGAAVAQLRGHGRGPPEHCNRAGLTWNTAKDDKKKNQQEHKIDEQSSMGSLDVAVPVGREADMAEVGLIQSLDGELICGVAVLLIFFSSI